MNGLTATIRNPDRWLGWARSLGARRMVIRRRNRPAMALLLRARPVTIRQNHRIFAPSFRWVADITARWANSPSQVLRKHPWSAVGTGPAVARPQIARELNVRDRTLRIETVERKLGTLFENISRRTRRLEASVARTEAVTVVRARSEAKDSSPAGQGFQHGPPATEIRSSTQSKPTGFEVSAINVERIAENVMRQLDNRVTAWRERMGRS